MIHILHRIQRPNQCAYVIARRLIAVVKTHRAEQVVFGSSVALAECLKRGIESAVILGNRHLIVVYQNEELSLKFTCGVEPLERLAAGERAVADDRNHLLRSAEQISRLRHAERKID